MATVRSVARPALTDLSMQLVMLWEIIDSETRWTQFVSIIAILFSTCCYAVQNQLSKVELTAIIYRPLNLHGLKVISTIGWPAQTRIHHIKQIVVLPRLRLTANRISVARVSATVKK